MEPPIYPEQSDCCGSGCTPCIFDIYERQLEKYNQFLQNGNLPLEPSTKNCLQETKYSPFTLISITPIAPDCNVYEFQHEGCIDCRVLHKPGQHLLIKTTDADSNFSRAYTILPNQAKNTFKVMVKLYENGRMSNYFRHIELGAVAFWRGPYGDYQLNSRYVLMICQGTGVAPFYSILDDQLSNPDCEIRFKLFFCCREIYFQKELLEMKAHWNFTYEVFSCKAEERYGEVVHGRRLSQEDIDRFFMEAEEMGIRGGVEVLICGSEDFSNEIRKLLLKHDPKCTVYIF